MAKKKIAPKKPPKNRLKSLYEALEHQVRSQLEIRRLAHRNAEARGDAAEEVWLDLLAEHLPKRYQVGKGIVIDADGKESHYIDIIVYDRQYTPPVFNKLYIPAESVYAVIEAKQMLNRANVGYAGRKAASVRRLRRTNGSVVHAGGRIDKPRDPFRIIAGIVTYKSTWTDPFGTSLQDALADLRPSQQIDFGIAVDDGYFEVEYEDDGPTISQFLKTRTLASFLIRLLAHLQKVGTVPVIEYDEYSKVLERND
jgi:hypothetical protein